MSPLDTVVLIGAGGIGSRHLQGLAGLTAPTRIDVVDPSARSRQVALERWEEVTAGHAHELLLHADLRSVPDRADVAIVATAADVRLPVLRDLLAVTQVGHVVLEKFLFQTDSEYDECDRLLDVHGARGWVNTSRRLWPGYREVRDLLDAAGPVSLRVATSARYGIGTTAIHFLDLLAFVGGESRFELRSDRLASTSEGSRRPGFIEFAGAIYGFGEAGGGFGYETYPDSTLPVVVEIVAPDVRLHVREADGRMGRARAADGWAWEEVAFGTALQSRLTRGVVEDLVARGTCGLPAFAESATLHRAILAAFRDALTRDTAAPVDRCPVT